MPAEFDVVVLGSATVDHLLRVQDRPPPGETAAATEQVTALGGTVAHRALAAARCGAHVAFVGAAGDDEAGASLVRQLKAGGIDTSHVAAAGAGGCLPPPVLPDASVLLAQLESPVDAVRAAMLAFRGIVVLNPAPSERAGERARELAALADVLVPDTIALARLAGAARVPAGPADALAMVRGLGYDGAAVVTLGPGGALVVDGDDAWHVGAPRVEVIDTTGAGDAFRGALAAALARGEGLLNAARQGAAAGTAAVTRSGAGAAMPGTAEIAAYLPAVTTAPVRAGAQRRSAAGAPAGFAWGVATSAYQIEGGVCEDGRGESTWDVFARQPGAIAGGATAATAADHYHRWQEDFRLLRDLGVSAYRFSVAWPRVCPDGCTANGAGLDFYDQVTDALLAAGITPYITLYHWDLPQALALDGGWLSRDTPARFADYVATVSSRLGDRVTSWLTINEPFEESMRGYAQGRHAPGRTSPAGGLRAAHHLLLAHGLGMQALRAASAGAQAGIVLNLYPVEPAGAGAADASAADRVDLVQNRLFLDPLLSGGYSGAARSLLARFGAGDVVRGADEAVIAAPMDFLGVNYYTAYTVTAGDGKPGAAPSAYPGAEDVRFVTTGRSTDMGLPVRPDGLGSLLRRLQASYAPPPIIITENGAAYRDTRCGSAVEDFRRAAFLRRHIAQVLDAASAGIEVRGYFPWTLLDDFEWSAGFTQRFGLVAVDFATGERLPKASYHWYRRFLGRTARPGTEESG